MEAVEEWMLSKHVVHVMRDHPGHDMPILAGMWGVKLEDSRGHEGRGGGHLEQEESRHARLKVEVMQA